MSRLYVKNLPRAGKSKLQYYVNIFSHYKMFAFTVDNMRECEENKKTPVILSYNLYSP